MEFATIFMSAADHNSCFLTSQPAINQHSAPSCTEVGEEGIIAATSHAQSIEQEAEKMVQQYCSFPKVGRHPHQAALETQGRAWLANLYRGRLPAARVQRLLDTRLETAGCVFYPQGFSDTRSLTLIKLMHWFFVLDDVFDDPHLLGHYYDGARRFACRHFKAMFGDDIKEAQAMGLIGAQGYDADVVIGTVEQAKDSSRSGEEDPLYAVSLARTQEDLVIEVGVQWASEMQAQGLSPRQVERMREGVAKYLWGIISVVRLRQEKRLPSLVEYIRLRRMDGADKLALLGCEFDLGIDLDDDTLDHPLMKTMHAKTADHALWLNDLLSFNREFHNEDFVSLLAVLHYNNSRNIGSDQHAVAKMTDFHEAIEEAHAMIKACDQERVRLAHEISMWRPDLHGYVQSLHFNVSGLTFWTLWSSRYQTKGPI